VTRKRHGDAAVAKQRRVEMSAPTRLKLGVALLILGLVMPAGRVLVVCTEWPGAGGKGGGGSLPVGFDTGGVSGAGGVGKDNFERIWAGAMRLLKALKPAGNVGRTRYKWGLYMLVGPTLYAWIASYAPSWLPEDYVLRVLVNVGLDLITLASLFVLGGDFWDKVRALFIHDARGVLPSRASTPPS